MTTILAERKKSLPSFTKTMDPKLSKVTEVLVPKPESTFHAELSSEEDEDQDQGETHDEYKIEVTVETVEVEVEVEVEESSEDEEIYEGHEEEEEEEEEEDSSEEVQRALFDSYQENSKRKANSNGKGGDDADTDSEDDEEWISSFTKWSLEKEMETSEAESELGETSELGATEQFQQLFLNNISLKPEIVTEIASIAGVHSVSWRFIDDKDEGQRPVVHITTTNEINQENLLEQVSERLHDKMFTKIPKNEVKRHLKILAAHNKPNVQAFETSQPGNELETTCQTQHPISGCFTGYLYAKMELKMKGIADRTYDAHYPVAPFHCILPAKSKKFREQLPELVPADLRLENRCLRHTVNVHESIPKLHHANDRHQMPSMLKATLFSEEAKQSMKEMEENNELKYKVLPSQQLRGFLTGKAGLIHDLTKKKKFFPVIVDVPEFSEEKNGYPPFYMHPCNVDIAVCKLSEERQVTTCSFEETFQTLEPNSDPILLFNFPSKAEDMKGEVVAINRGEIITLSSKSPSSEFHIKDLKFPCIQWDLESETDIEGRVLSGSPVFVKYSTGSLRFLGGLYSKETAFHAKFSLELIRPEICEHFTQEVRQKLKATIEKERDSHMKEKLKTLEQWLKKFQKRTEQLTKHCSTAWSDNIPFEVLCKHNQTNIDTDGTINCTLEFCTHKHHFIVQ